jgi:hypothetical protein
VAPHWPRGGQSSAQGHRSCDIGIEVETVLDAVDAGINTGACTDEIRRMRRHLRAARVRLVDDRPDVASRPPCRKVWGLN